MTERQSRPLCDRLLTLFVLLTCLRVWLGPFGAEPIAEAQITNAGAQRKQIVTNTQQSAELLGELKALVQSMKSHTFQVKVVAAEVEKKGGE